MANNGEQTGLGCQLQKELTDGTAFVSILGIKSISGPDISRDTHDVTDMDSAQFREFIGGLVDAGEISFDANFLPRDTTQNQSDDGFMAEFDKGSCDSRGNWRIVLPGCDGDADAIWEFAGIVSGQSIELPMDDVMSFSGTIKVSGRPVLYVEGQDSSI